MHRVREFLLGLVCSQIQALFEHLEATGAGCGGPDIKPGDTTVGQDYWMGDTGSQDYRGTICAGFANQNASVTGGRSPSCTTSPRTPCKPISCSR